MVICGRKVEADLNTTQEASQDEKVRDQGYEKNRRI